MPSERAGILHTILFHRALGLVRPKDVDSEHFEITYQQQQQKENEGKGMYNLLLMQILLSFYEEKNKQVSWFTNKVERQHWEQWYINLHIMQPNVHGRSGNTRAALDPAAGNKKEESSSRHASLEASLREVLFQIIKFVNEKKDHIPPVPNLDCIVSFPFEITVPSHSDSSFGVEILKRMLQTGHPTMLS
ncbi:hypothetical protein Taro_040140 [Colocasia esculenta]|uniref:Autophagy-related protein 101 n=1 Tax=Colocasia esculenta TaxID=4460 RepID=A0A843WXM8_COLES|nr:hypothetical protein [Colocasia esculenta]